VDDGLDELEMFGRYLHPGTRHFIKLFAYDHLPEHLQKLSKPCHDLAMEMIKQSMCGQELSAGLRKLLEAKDCFVRSLI
jgi:hypothetical protein